MALRAQRCHPAVTAGVTPPDDPIRMSIRVLLADDHPIFPKGVRLMLEDPHLNVVDGSGPG